MIKPIQAILKLLQGKVILKDGTDVRIRKRPYPQDMTPCISIDSSGGTSIINKNIINKNYQIPVNHPQYDPNNPEQTISQQVIREERGIILNLNVWCDLEDERGEILNILEDIFNKAQSDHYSCCMNYVNGDCDYLNNSCKAINSNTSRGAKGQCPAPEDYNYINIFTRFDIIRPSFDIAPAYDLDDFNMNPPVLRSIIRVSFSYYDYYCIGGVISKELTLDEELI